MTDTQGREKTTATRGWTGAVSAGFVVAFVVGCAGGSGASTRCQSGSNALVAAISSGLKVPGDGTIRAAQAVKSTAFQEAYFVSADLEGEGLSGNNEIATWVTNKLDGSGAIYSVGAVSRQFSSWGPGEQTDANFKLTDDGAQQSIDCVRETVK